MFSPERSVEEDELSIISDIAEMLSPNRRVAAAIVGASLERQESPVPILMPLSLTSFA